MSDRDLIDDTLQIDLVDYGRIRDEIDSRTKLSSQMLNYELIVIAAIITAYDKVPHEVTILGTWISSLLWLMWLDHTTAIYKLAAYLQVVIARRLRKQHKDVFGWEYFLRELDAGGDRARHVLYEGLHDGLPAAELRVPRTEAITNYIRLLFGGGALLLMAMFLRETYSSIIGCLSTILQRAWPTVTEGRNTVLFLIGIWLLVKAWRAERRLNRLARVVARAIKAV